MGVSTSLSGWQGAPWPHSRSQRSLRVQGRQRVKVFLLLLEPPLCKMGLSSTKAHPKVTKVAPMRAGEDLPTLAAQYQLSVVPGQPSLHPPSAAAWRNPSFHQQLPPLRETWYGRSAGKGVITEGLRSAGQRPPGPLPGAAICSLWHGVGGGLCTHHLASVTFCHFQDILALGKYFPPPKTVLESTAATRTQVSGSLLPSAASLQTATLPSIDLAPGCA